ncbi:hypothetical protein O181_091143 [Austropuccinia psidii MF-1]|uniref:Uncharacterized protein n=1 Tax=Austropuccinia psidii MF-1 TaxID=1389203 RepID=A0A9Q3IWT1_9BASI|nr:hypothetical protein [Austropuccinia psidii MF-1]
MEKEEPVASKSSKTAPEQPKHKPKVPQSKQRGPRNNQGKGKGKANWNRPYPQGYRIPKLEHSAMDSVVNMTRSLMDLTPKEQERMKSTFPQKIIDEMRYNQSIMDIKFNKIETESGNLHQI